MKKIIFGCLIFILTISSILIAKANPTTGKNGMVVSASFYASQVGIEILKKGGNAVDASVAVGFALAVTYPYAGNLGGGGFKVIHLADGTNTSIDYREKAPLKAHRDMFINEKGEYQPDLSRRGGKSVAVPGSVGGLIYALEKYGTMSLAEVIQPAIDLAEDGWILDKETADSFIKYSEEFKKYKSSKKIFLNEGKFYKEGDLFIQKDLAFTLKKIRDEGLDGFYSGKIAELLVSQIENVGGIISKEDLGRYKPVEREVVNGNYRGYEIISMGPPSSGGIALIELLNILENFSFNSYDWGSSAYINKLVESMKYVYADRTKYLGDEDYYSVPKERLISKDYAKKIFNSLKPFALPSKTISQFYQLGISESNETTHYSVYDKFGNAVSTTTTINSAFGSKIVVEGAGFLLNNEMDDFSAQVGKPNQFGLLGSEANSIQPEKRMLSSMTPTIVLKENKPYIIVGSPGGSTIITVVLQVILNCIDFGMNIQEAVNAPRVHHQWFPDKIYLEKFSVSADVAENLEKLGYTLANRNETFRILGSAQAIMIDQKNNIIYGAADPRKKTSTAIGY